LINENAKYREETSSKRMCIVPSGLDMCVNNTRDFLRSEADSGISTVAVDNPQLAEGARSLLYGQVDSQIDIVRNWFSDNYDELLYDTNGNIPFPIIMKMRGELGRWALKEISSFDRPMTELIEESIRDGGLNPKSYESHQEMWDYLKTI
jgi:hypothetical protein